MSSPCKRIKLTPKKQLDSPQHRYTQESKVTSTPQRLSGKVISPNISRISSTPSSVRKCLSDSFEKEHNITQDSISSSDEPSNQSLSSRSSTPFSTRSIRSGIAAIEDYDQYIREFHGIKYTGKVWKCYKPLHDNTLYAQIIQDPQNVQEVVTELLLLYNVKPEYALVQVLKFCVDVCGFQNFEISDHYNIRENNSKRIIEIMETIRVLDQQEVLINTGRYLLMESKANLAKILKSSIYNFLQKLIVCAHDKGILYDGFFAKQFFVFIKCMSFSMIRAIRHTGVVFGIKILTAIVIVFNKISNEENSSDSSTDNIQLQKQEINNYLEFLYFIFIKNCRLQENRLVLMRIECIYELSFWIRYFPKIFITQLQTVNYLLKLVSDPSKDVRLAALQTCQALIETPSILSILKNSIPDFIEHIGQRFYDIDIKVSVKAIDIYRTLLKYDVSLITRRRFEFLMLLVFDKLFPIGEAASKFLIYYLERTENSQEVLLVQLAKLSMKPGDATKQLLVEGCLYNCTSIQNWKLYINIFLRNDIELDIKEHLAELFSEAMHQVLVGKSSIMREKSRKVAVINPEEHKRIATYFPAFFTLLEKYKDCSKIVLEFLKILILIKDDALNGVSIVNVKNICSVMEQLFDHQNDEELLKKLCETFFRLSKTNHAHHIQNITDSIISRYANDLKANLTNVSQEIDRVTLKVSILFENFNLSNRLEWETLFDSWSAVDEFTVGNLQSCCKWYLIWSLRYLTTTENPLVQFPVLISACKEFISTCFNMLKNLGGQALHFKTYICLCDIHITYMEDLEEQMKSFKQLEQLKLIINDKQLQEVLIHFLENRVINEITMPLFERRLYVKKYIDLVHLNILPIECLANIFKYYYKYNKEYGPMIDSSLSGMAESDENTFLLMVVYTLTISYENILNKYNAIDMTTQETKDLKFLIKQFLNFKQFKSPDKKVTKLILFAINYSLKDESKYSFFYFLKYFVDLVINKDDRKELSDFLKERVPITAEKNDAVLFLANCIKNQQIKTQKPTNISIPKKNKENKKPEKKILPRKKALKVTKKKLSITQKKPEKAKKQKNIDIETDVSEDDLTIHDSESDDLDESFKSLRV